MSIEAIIFDLDGVLIDSGAAHRESWQQLGRELGVTVATDDFAATFGRQNRDIVPILFGAERSPAEVRRLSDRKEELYRDLVRGRMPVNEGAREIVRHFHKAGYKLAIGSSTPRANIDLALEEMGASGLFSAIVSSDEVTVGKPDPAVFLEAAGRLQIGPLHCLVVEDAPAGVEAGLSAGMRVVALCGSHPRERLSRAHVVIDKLAELLTADLRLPL